MERRIYEDSGRMDGYAVLTTAWKARSARKEPRTTRNRASINPIMMHSMNISFLELTTSLRTARKAYDRNRIRVIARKTTSSEDGRLTVFQTKLENPNDHVPRTSTIRWYRMKPGKGQRETNSFLAICRCWSNVFGVTRWMSTRANAEPKWGNTCILKLQLSVYGLRFFPKCALASPEIKHG